MREVWAWGAVYEIKADAPICHMEKWVIHNFSGHGSYGDEWGMMMEHGQSEMHNAHPAQESRVWCGHWVTAPTKPRGKASMINGHCEIQERY